MTPNDMTFFETTRTDVTPSAPSVDFSQSLLAQIQKLLPSLIEAPYSALVSNLILIVVACVLVAVGILISWIARHPDEVRRLLTRWRQRSRASRAERYVRQSFQALPNIAFCRASKPCRTLCSARLGSSAAPISSTRRVWFVLCHCACRSRTRHLAVCQHSSGLACVGRNRPLRHAGS